LASARSKISALDQTNVIAATDRCRPSALSMIGLRGANALAESFASELRSGEVKALMIDWELPMMNLFAVFPAGRLASAKPRAFSVVEQCMTERPQETDPNTHGVPHLLPKPT
jgi:hypothetical protein